MITRGIPRFNTYHIYKLGLRDAGIDQLNFHSVQLGYLKLLQMGTQTQQDKAGNKYEVKPQYEKLSKQLGGRHSNPVVTTPTIALDLSGATHQSDSPNVAPNQIPPGSNHAAGHFLEAEICYNIANILAQSHHKYANPTARSLIQFLHFYAGINY
ncbi:clathrin assembly protein [Dorcoceras hygrometricum]|uniref:Clathrin assembly protein n=1 Tax=Dorcoceras hygrometricum TaxID=472368 RepID=A0A2Z7AZP4_9LAMI|nr:clathrin assembly protein [Dorcoceras hygrometricum]